MTPCPVWLPDALSFCRASQASLWSQCSMRTRSKSIGQDAQIPSAASPDTHGSASLSGPPEPSRGWRTDLVQSERFTTRVKCVKRSARPMHCCSEKRSAKRLVLFVCCRNIIEDYPFLILDQGVYRERRPTRKRGMWLWFFRSSSAAPRTGALPVGGRLEEGRGQLFSYTTTR